LPPRTLGGVLAVVGKLVVWSVELLVADRRIHDCPLTRYDLAELMPETPDCKDVDRKYYHAGTIVVGTTVPRTLATQILTFG